MARGLLAARTHSICWLAISMMWPMPMMVVTTTSPTALGHSTKPAEATAMIAEPIQIVSASLPRSMKRPTCTAITIGNAANAAAMTPSQTIDRSSSKARYDVVMRMIAVTTCTSTVSSSSGISSRTSNSLLRTRSASLRNIGRD